MKDITGHWAENDIRAVVKWGLMGGYPDGTFKPDQPISRAEFAAVVRRLVDATPANRVVFDALHSATYIMSSFEVPQPDGSKVLARAVGSGCWVAPWTVLTNAHVVSYRTENGNILPAKEIAVWGYPKAGFSPDSMQASATVVLHEYDLAVLKVQPPDYQVETKPIPLGTAMPDVGDTVWAVGNPFGMPWDVCSGTIRHPVRHINYWQRLQPVVALAVPINPGNSGGMLLNVYGELVGVPCAGIRGANVYTFAVPLEHIRGTLKAAGVI